MSIEEEYLLRVIGKAITHWPITDFYELKERYEKFIIDLGTGDGKHTVQWAQKNPQDFILGIDANTTMLVKSAMRTVTSVKKGGLSNMAFIQCAAEKLPIALHDVDSIHILMPWGSLLREIFPRPGRDSSVLSGLRAIARSGTQLVVTLNLHAWRPPVPEVGDLSEPDADFILDVLANQYANYGITITSSGEVDDDIRENYSTSWSKRLASSRDDFSVLVFRGLFQ